MGIGFSELAVILIIVLIVFGGGKLPSVLGDLGKGVKAFKEGMGEAPKKRIAAPRRKPSKGKK